MSDENENTIPVEEERRQLIRVERTAIIELTPLPNVVPINEQAPENPELENEYLEAGQLDAQLAWGDTSEEDDDKLFYLMRELQTIDLQSRTALSSLKSQAPELGVALEAINRKINSIGEALCDDMFDSNDELQSIDLSVGGIGFNHAERLLEGSYHKLKLWFDNTNVGVCAHIKVLACNRAINGGHHISAMFSSISETDQQIVRKHIMLIEAQMRRDAAALKTVLDG